MMWRVNFVHSKDEQKQLAWTSLILGCVSDKWEETCNYGKEEGEDREWTESLDEGADGNGMEAHVKAGGWSFFLHSLLRRKWHFW